MINEPLPLSCSPGVATGLWPDGSRRAQPKRSGWAASNAAAAQQQRLHTLLRRMPCVRRVQILNVLLDADQLDQIRQYGVRHAGPAGAGLACARLLVLG